MLPSHVLAPLAYGHTQAAEREEEAKAAMVSMQEQMESAKAAASKDRKAAADLESGLAGANE